MDDHVDEAGHRIGGGGADPLLQQQQGLAQLEPGAGQQVDDEIPAQAGSQCPIDPLLKQLQRVAILAEEIEQHQVVAGLALLEEGEGIGLMHLGSTVIFFPGMLEKLAIEGDHLLVQLDALVPGRGPAAPDMARQIAATQPQLEDVVGLLWQQAGDHLLVGQAEGGGVVQ